MNLLRTLGATMRLTRLIISDDIGDWWIKTPLDTKMSAWMIKNGRAEEPAWYRYRDGLECPYCVGFWIGLGVLGAELAAEGSTTLTARVWRLTAGALTLNEVAARLGIALGDYDRDEESNRDDANQ